MEKIRMLVSLVLLTTLAGICRADKGVDLADENAQLKQRVDKLEKEVEELKKLVMQQSQVKVIPVTQPAAPVVAAKPVEPNAGTLKLSEADMQKIIAMIEKEPKTKKPVWADLDVQLYARLKADASYDTARTNVGNYVQWVLPGSAADDHSEFDMTANETRIGMNITGPSEEGCKTSGRVEIDFYGGGTAENKPNPMMRHAYMTLDWPADRFSILAGQTSDVISPLYPYTLNYSVAWWAGNIGYRRPQIRLTKSCALDKDVDLKFEAAATRDIGTSDFVRDAGENSGIPGFQSRVSLQFPWLKQQPTTIGVSGHWAKEKYYTSPTGATGDNDEYNSWSLNLDVTQPINEWLTLKGELFTGQDLAAYLGGIGNGVNTNLGTEVSSKGGWVAASLTPCSKWNFNFGVSVDNPENSDVAGLGNNSRDFNRSIFGNVIYSINKNTEIGFELSQWRTEYLEASDNDAIRAQTSFIYKF